MGHIHSQESSIIPVRILRGRNFSHLVTIFENIYRMRFRYASCCTALVVDARAGPSLKTTLKPKKMKPLPSNRMKSNQISKLQKELKRHNSDAHSTTSSASPAHSPCYSNQSDDGSDTEMAPGSSRTPVFSFLDLTYWKRQKVCCGIIYKGRFGEVLIDTHLFKPCCRNKQPAAEKSPPPVPPSSTIPNQEEW
uniref:SIN3-HDAC complex associated factor n=1 Tax=Laticauda laticaudata TaxID=8630 RepID=A0A8C5WUW2_LATLA